MKGPGILWMLQTAAGMSMAGPMFVVGLELARDGRPVAGAGFFALGAAALYFPTYLINRIGGPRTWLRRRFGGSDDPEATSDGGDDADADEGDDDGSRLDAGGESTSPLGRLERLRRR